MTPDQFLEIAKKDVIRPGLLKNTSVFGEPEQLVLEPTTHTGKGRHFGSCSVYMLKQANGAPPDFPAYVCDYAEGTLNYQMLGLGADICVTTTINGCTFGLGTPGPDGSVIVSHTNMKPSKMDDTDKVALGYDPMDGDFQTNTQLQIARQFHHGHGSYIDPSVYWEGGDRKKGLKVNVTVLGVRRPAGWKFYYQKFTVGPGQVHKFLGFYRFSKTAETF